MALIQLSELISAIRGSIGGVTFSRNRAGQIAKSKSNGRKSYTAKQANEIKFQSFAVGQWQNLSLINQNLWNDYSDLYPQIDKFGTTKYLSGFNWFSHVNNLNYKINSSIMETPPERITAEIVPQFEVEALDETLNIVLSEPIEWEDNVLFIFASFATQQTNKTNRGNIRLIKTVIDPNFTNLDITNEWEEYFNVDWSTLTPNSNFNIQIFLYSVNSISWLNSVGVWAVGELGIPAGNLRIIESGEYRIIESGEYRIIE